MKYVKRYIETVRAFVHRNFNRCLDKKAIEIINLWPETLGNLLKSKLEVGEAKTLTNVMGTVTVTASLPLLQ